MPPAHLGWGPVSAGTGRCFKTAPTPLLCALAIGKTPAIWRVFFRCRVVEDQERRQPGPASRTENAAADSDIVKPWPWAWRR